MTCGLCVRSATGGNAVASTGRGRLVGTVRRCGVRSLAVASAVATASVAAAQAPRGELRSAFPNGRELTDDVVDLVGHAGTLANDAPFPTTNDVPFLDVFPYLAPPQ